MYSREESTGVLVYVLTDDGVFERWMDEHNPDWERANTDNIKLWREIWEAARRQYGSEEVG